MHACRYLYYEFLPCVATCVTISSNNQKHSACKSELRCQNVKWSRIISFQSLAFYQILSNPFQTDARNRCNELLQKILSTGATNVKTYCCNMKSTSGKNYNSISYCSYPPSCFAFIQLFCFDHYVFVVFAVKTVNAQCVSGCYTKQIFYFIIRLLARSVIAYVMLTYVCYVGYSPTLPSIGGTSTAFFYGLDRAFSSINRP